MDAARRAAILHVCEGVVELALRSGAHLSRYQLRQEVMEVADAYGANYREDEIDEVLRDTLYELGTEPEG